MISYLREILMYVKGSQLEAKGSFVARWQIRHEIEHLRILELPLVRQKVLERAVGHVNFSLQFHQPTEIHHDFFNFLSTQNCCFVPDVPLNFFDTCRERVQLVNFEKIFTLIS